MKVHDCAEYCDLVAESFSAYLDHSLPASLEGEIAAHLEECESCRLRLEGVVALIANLNGLGEVEAGTELGWSVKKAVHRYARRETSPTALRPLPFLASAAAAAVVLVIIGISGTDEMSPIPQSMLNPGSQQAEQSAQLDSRYVLPPLLEDLHSTGLIMPQVAETDTTSKREPSRLRGIRAVSF